MPDWPDYARCPRGRTRRANRARATRRSCVPARAVVGADVPVVGPPGLPPIRDDAVRHRRIADPQFHAVGLRIRLFLPRGRHGEILRMVDVIFGPPVGERVPEAERHPRAHLVMTQPVGRRPRRAAAQPALFEFGPLREIDRRHVDGPSRRHMRAQFAGPQPADAQIAVEEPVNGPRSRVGAARNVGAHEHDRIAARPDAIRLWRQVRDGNAAIRGQGPHSHNQPNGRCRLSARRRRIDDLESRTRRALDVPLQIARGSHVEGIRRILDHDHGTRLTVPNDGQRMAPGTKTQGEHARAHSSTAIHDGAQC